MTQDLSGALAPLLSDIGLELYDLEVRGSVVVVTVDRPGGVDLDTLSSATHAVGDLLDELEPVPGRYTLEVTSPGLERRLRTAAQFGGAIGQTVTVRTNAGGSGIRRLTGRLAGADGDGIVLECPEPDGSVRIGYEDIERARTVFSWGSGPAPSPSRGKAGSRPTRARAKGADAKTERVTTP